MVIIDTKSKSERYRDGRLIIAKILYGSQNYNLDTKESDFDYFEIVCPNFEDLYKGVKLSKDVETENGLIKVKDVRTWFTYLSKNINFLECLYSIDVQIYDLDFERLWDNLTANKDVFFLENPWKMYNSLVGMCVQKQKAIEKNLPNLVGKDKGEFREKYGYDPKQLLHIFRIADIVNDLFNGKPINLWVEDSKKQDYLKLKTMETKYDSKEKALEKAKEIIEQLNTEEIKTYFRNLEKSKTLLKNVLYRRVNELEGMVREYIKGKLENKNNEFELDTEITE